MEIPKLPTKGWSESYLKDTADMKREVAARKKPGEVVPSLHEYLRDGLRGKKKAPPAPEMPT